MAERRISLLNGPNMTNLGRRDQHIYGTIESLAALEGLVVDTGRAFGLAVEPFRHNEEGGLVDHIEQTVGQFDGYLINPGGLWAYGDPTRIALQATGRPVVEVHFANIHATGGRSVFTESVDGTVMGMRQFGYLGAIVSLAYLVGAQP
jgi:3-dehydroquinate dehydratase II